MTHEIRIGGRRRLLRLAAAVRGVLRVLRDRARRLEGAHRLELDPRRARPARRRRSRSTTRARPSGSPTSASSPTSLTATRGVHLDDLYVDRRRARVPASDVRSSSSCTRASREVGTGRRELDHRGRQRRRAATLRRARHAARAGSPTRWTPDAPRHALGVRRRSRRHPCPPTCARASPPREAAHRRRRREPALDAHLARGPADRRARRRHRRDATPSSTRTTPTRTGSGSGPSRASRRAA